MSMKTAIRAAGTVCVLSFAALMVSGTLFEQLRIRTSLRRYVLQASVATQDATMTSVTGTVTSVTGTVRTVDLTARTLEVITGVGHALRLVQMQVSPEGRISVEGATGQLGDLRRGDVIRVEYRETPQGNVAERIETVRRTSQGERK
jgi:hypothetical protein